MNYFVYVVCGAAHYIDQLNLSLKFLRHYSDHPILIVTDTNRNEHKIDHDEDRIIDRQTPAHYNNNQASIFLETSLGEILDFENDQKYFYIDSDFIACDKNINQVFSLMTDYPLFTDDHCTVQYHSPHAMNCTCQNKFHERENILNKIQNTFPNIENNSSVNECQQKLNEIFQNWKNKPLKNLPEILRYTYLRYLSKKQTFSIQSNFLFNKKDRIWQNRKGENISYDNQYYLKQIHKKWGYHQADNNWFDRNNVQIKAEKPYCQHLSEFLKEKYALDIDKDFQHWNGGAFLFDRRSIPALNTWKEVSIEMLENKNLIVKYTDQLSLIVTAFRHGFSDKVRLPKQYNFICEHDNQNLSYSQGQLSTNGGETHEKASFLHVYHHWNDTNWNFWQELMNSAEAEGVKLK